MYLNLHAEVLISIDGDVLRLRSIQDAKIRSSWRTLTDTALITIPRLYKIDDKNADIREYLTPGTSIELNLGYNGDLSTEFSGYVTGWEGTGPITLECEDEMYNLKKPNKSKTYYKTSLESLIADLAPGYEVSLEAVNIGDFMRKNATPVQVLKELSEHPYNLFAYFPLGSKVLNVGFPYHSTNPTRHILHLQRNLKSASLSYRNLQQDTIQVRVISHLDNGQILETIYPMNLEGASQRTLNVMNIDTINELISYAKAERSKFNFSGYEGSITSFGVPTIRHGDEVDIRDERYPERTGVYLVDDVVTEFNSRSADFKRTINIGLKV